MKVDTRDKELLNVMNKPYIKNRYQESKGVGKGKLTQESTETMS